MDTNSSTKVNKHDDANTTPDDYVCGLDDKEQLAYKIAKNHLGTSFSLVKSIGYKKYSQKRKDT